jgi:hypothetical protein
MNDPKKQDITAAQELFKRARAAADKKPRKPAPGGIEKKPIPGNWDRWREAPLPPASPPASPADEPATPPKQPPMDKTPTPPKYYPPGRRPEDLELERRKRGIYGPKPPTNDLAKRLEIPEDSPLPIKIPGKKPYKLK